VLLHQVETHPSLRAHRYVVVDAVASAADVTLRALPTADHLQFANSDESDLMHPTLSGARQQAMRLTFCLREDVALWTKYRSCRLGWNPSGIEVGGAGISSQPTL